MNKTQRIKITNSGRAFVTHYRTRIYLDEVMKTQNTEDGGCIGVQPICNWGGYIIKLNPDNETAMVSLEMGD